MLLLLIVGTLAANPERAETLHDMCKRYVVRHVVDKFLLFSFHVLLPKCNVWHIVFY